MINKLLRYLYLSFPILLFNACSDEIKIADKQAEIIYSDCPVELFTEGVEQFSTRGVTNPKRFFLQGDIIHVEAYFIDESDEEIENSRIYRAYELIGNSKWETVTHDDIFWPVRAKKGVFKAYYVSQFNQSLVADDAGKLLNLSDIQDDTDPLLAEAQIDWGHKVNLRFHHICTHLTFSNLDPDIADYFWLIKKDGTSISNLFNLRLEGSELKHEFRSVSDETNNDLVYVQHKSVTLYDNQIKTGSEVSFFLQPGDYSNLELRTINNYSYLAFQSELTQDLQSNVPYVIDIKNNKGVTFIEEEEDWDEDDSTILEIDPDVFLNAIVNGEEGEDYIIEDEDGNKKIIIKITSDGALLCANVNFKFSTEYTKRELTNGRNFDGGNHFIYNLATNLFTTNQGTIQHLGLKNINCTDDKSIVLTYESEDIKNNRWGILCETNVGTVKNIRIEDSEVNFSLGIGSESGGKVFYVGSLIGSNEGNVAQIEYNGNISIQTSTQDDIKSILYLGGIVGHSIGTVREIRPYENNQTTAQTPTISVISNLKGESLTIFAGGGVGLASGLIQDISLPSVMIDSSNSLGMVGSTGGLVGRLRGEGYSPSSLSSCTVAGIVRGMPVSSVNNFQAYSYTGGLSGFCFKYNITDCRTLCSVSINNENSSDEMTTYATGGGIGRIVGAIETPISIKNNYIWPKDLEGPAKFIGNFAGIVPLGYDFTWTSLSNNGNVAKDFLEGKYIGDTIDDTPPED